MWSQLVLCCLVGLAAASDYGWKSNTEYMYKVHGRTLTGLHEVANQYSGIVMKANLIVRPQSDGILMAKMSDAKYAQVHTQLPEGWRSEIPEDKLSYKQLPLSDKPFEIVLKNGVVRDIIVSKDVHNWEANLLKSIVSQMQLDTQGEHVIKSHVNQLPEEGSNNAVFKTLEATVTGKYETLYDISPLPEYVLQSQPWLAPMPQMKGDGEFIEIVKNKNFSRGEERVGYHFGLGQNGEWEPSTNQMGEFFLRSSVSRAIISGNLKRYTIQSSVTTNKIILSPTLNSEQKGMVVSQLNLTLSHVQPASSQFEKLQQPQNLGSLIYRYSSPFSGNHEARSHQQRESSEENVYSSEERSNNVRHHYRNRRAANSAEKQYDSLEETHEWSTQDQPKLNEAPESPLLPMYIGYNGKSIKSAQQVNIVQAVQKIAQQIGQEIQRPEHIPEKQTLAKFTILSSLIRIMSEKEMQEVAREIYSKEQEGPKTDAWKAYRDAVAQCGTGPALLTIQDWILSKKIRTEEAAEVIASMAQSVRQPTPEYMRAFYALATKEEVKEQRMLNTTAILSYASLVRKVYIDKEFSHNQYPVHSFGTFRKNSGKEFVAQEFIPYLKQQLAKAIQHADSQQIQVYIRALGNVAHQQILAVFEPYLEGHKQVSQFQRLQMVLALDKLAEIHPKIARGVLYKVYQNAGEAQEIRAAAVYQLMRTCPPASMLQRMAQYTNVDTDEHVNAAVKSAIESAAELQGEQNSELSENARSAQPLLTKQTYGVQYSRNHLRSYVVEEMNLFYQQHMHIFGSQDSSIPKGIRYGLGIELNGVQSDILTVEGMVSSIDELTNVFQQQTEIHQQRQQQQKQNHKQAQENQFSSESIARLLNIESDEREQFEGNMLFKLGSGATRFFSFDNQTVELLPRALREIEDMLRTGEKIHYTKFLNREDITVSFPTEMSLPFVYTLDAPTLFHIRGEISATAEPKISSGDKLHKPHTVTARAQLRAVATTKLQAKLGFVTPFDHQEYVAGFDKNIQFNIPMKTEIELDIKNKQMQIQLQPLEADKNTQIFHYSTWPYTAQQDILNLEPIANNEHNNRIIYSDRTPVEFQTVVGRKAGMAFRVAYKSEQQFMDARWLYDQFQRHDAISAILAPYHDETLQHTKIDIEYDVKESTSDKVQIRLGYEQRYENEQTNESNAPNADIQQFSKLPRESKARQQQFAKMASAGINSAVVSVYDIAVAFPGNSKVEYTATAAVAQGPVDEKARVLFYLKKHSANEHESKPYEVAMSAKARVPNTNGLDYEYALKFDPTTTVQVELAFGEDLKSATKFNFQAKLEQSESRRHYLQSSSRAHECRREMQEGNQQLPACANMTQEANLLDRVHVQVHFENMTPAVRNMTQKVFNAVRYLTYLNLEENQVNAQGNGKEDQLDMEARFNPDFESVNITLRTHKYEAHLKNIRVNQWAKQIVVIHPVFPVHSRIMSQAFEYDTYRPFCVVDQTAANTFDNKTYPIDLGNAWHVMLQYVPAFARQHSQHQKYQQQQQNQQVEQFAVLVRDSKSGKDQKEVKMTIRTPESQGQLIEIEMQPAGQQGQYSGSSPAAKVLVNQKQYQFNDKKSTDIEGGLIKIYALPNGEVKIEVRDNFYVIYDGERVKITAQHDKFRDAVRGLCGTFTGEQSDDFLTPKNCILRNPLEFAATYAVEQQGRVQEYKSRADKSACYEKTVEYTNVISDYDVGRSHQEYRQKHNQHRSGSGSDSCTKHQTQYVEEGSNQICFTIRPLPVCKSSCNASTIIKKSVPVHCIESNNISQLWVNQIRKGASPDFSQKSTTKTLKIEVPESCSKY